MRTLPAYIIRNEPKLFQGSFEVVDNFLGNDTGIGKIGGVFEAVVCEPDDVETGFVAGHDFIVVIGTPATIQFLV